MEIDCREAQGNLQENENVLYLDYNDGFMSINIRKIHQTIF